jgi:UDP-N-acetylglucosamine acyltransferase
MAYSHVAHDCIVGSHCVMSNCTALAGHVELGDWVISRATAGVHQFCKIGAHAFLANNAAVTRDVPPYLLVAGSPAEPKGVNSEGLQAPRASTRRRSRTSRTPTGPVYRSGLKLPRRRSSCARSCRSSRSSRRSWTSSAASERSIHPLMTPIAR